MEMRITPLALALLAIKVFCVLIVLWAILDLEALLSALCAQIRVIMLPSYFSLLLRFLLA